MVILESMPFQCQCPTVSTDLVSIDGDPDLSALATKAELASGLREKLGIDALQGLQL
jgi:hypothetical protein